MAREKDHKRIKYLKKDLKLYEDYVKAVKNAEKSLRTQRSALRACRARK